MNKDSHLIWENFNSQQSKKSIDKLIYEEFQADVDRAIPLMRQQLIDEGILSNVGNAIGRGYNAVKTGVGDFVAGVQGGAAGDAPVAGGGVKDMASSAWNTAKELGSKASGAVSTKLIQPLLTKAWTFLQQKAPDVAQRISAAINAGDAAAIQREVQAGGGDAVKNQVQNTPVETVAERNQLFAEYLTTYKLVSEADTIPPAGSEATGEQAPGAPDQQAAAQSAPQEDKGGSMISKAMSWMKKNPNLTTAGALGLIGLASVALGGWPLLIVAAKGAGWGALAGGGMAGGSTAIAGAVQGKGFKQTAKDAMGAAVSGLRKGAVVGSGAGLVSGLMNGVGQGGGEVQDQAPGTEPGAEDPNFDGTQDVSRGDGSAPGETPAQGGDPNYDQSADIDLDGDVDARDEALYKMQQRYDAAGVNADASIQAGGPGMDQLQRAPVAAPVAPVVDPSQAAGIAGGIAGAASRPKRKKKQPVVAESSQDIINSLKPGWISKTLN